MRFVASVLCLFYAVQMIAAPADVEARRQQLNSLIAELWEWNLQQNPVFASIIGDKRYNEQLGSSSEKTILEQQAKDKEFLKRFQAIDPTGLPHQDVLNRELEIRDLKQDIEGTDLKLWQMPVNQMGGIHIDSPQLVTVLSFQTVKDYDDYIARLRQLPRLFDEETANMRKGMANGLMPPKFLLEKVVEQTNGIATLAPDQTPFAQPFKDFPASFSDADKTRLKAAGLVAIKDDVLPAYARSCCKADASTGGVKSGSGIKVAPAMSATLATKRPKACVSGAALSTRSPDLTSNTGRHCRGLASSDWKLCGTAFGAVDVPDV